MAITLADFTKIWASTSPLTPYSFSDANYQEGWNFIGATPPARQMWDSVQKQNDEKLKYIVDNFLPTAGGTMTGAIVGNPLTLTADDGNGNTSTLELSTNSLKLNGENVGLQKYGVLGGFLTGAEPSLTFTIINDIATVIVKRGNSYGMYVLTYWDASPSVIAQSSTAPVTFTKSADSPTVTITRAQSIAYKVQIFNGYVPI